MKRHCDDHFCISSTPGRWAIIASPLLLAAAKRESFCGVVAPLHLLRSRTTLEIFLRFHVLPVLLYASVQALLPRKVAIQKDWPLWVFAFICGLGVMASFFATRDPNFNMEMVLFSYAGISVVVLGVVLQIRDGLRRRRRRR